MRAQVPVRRASAEGRLPTCGEASERRHDTVSLKTCWTRRTWTGRKPYSDAFGEVAEACPPPGLLGRSLPAVKVNAPIRHYMCCVSNARFPPVLVFQPSNPVSRKAAGRPRLGVSTAADGISGRCRPLPFVPRFSHRDGGVMYFFCQDVSLLVSLDSPMRWNPVQRNIDATGKEGMQFGVAKPARFSFAKASNAALESHATATEQR
ncbi:hypothetical protein HPB51_019911 [Rhipicephalus microplus]|uniref:Uncharacterized protein n=1 Tax=Rhipicephalus microplus TaxID=6941 RepID=A0A9J6E3S4_RHIMP|nr:hypothetical protein HPB51_019911 [Rhipicephalus microplus]